MFFVGLRIRLYDTTCNSGICCVIAQRIRPKGLLNTDSINLPCGLGCVDLPHLPFLKLLFSVCLNVGDMSVIFVTVPMFYF